MDSTTDVAAATVDIAGEPTEVVYVSLVDAYVRDRELVLSIDDADELVSLLEAAVAA